MTRLSVFIMALAMTIAGCENSGSRHSAGDSGLLPDDTSTVGPKADWADNDEDGSTDGAVDNGSEEFDADVVSNDDTDSETPVSCPQIDLPATLRDQGTGKIATLTRLSEGGRCGVHLECDFFNGDLWGNDSPFTADPDIFGDVSTLYRVSDSKWKLINDLVGEEYASVLETY